MYVCVFVCMHVCLLKYTFQMFIWIAGFYFFMQWLLLEQNYY